MQLQKFGILAVLSLITILLFQAQSSSDWTDYCDLGNDAFDGTTAIVCTLPVNAKTFATTSSPHHDNRTFRANAPVPLYGTANNENGDWDIGDKDGVLEVHGFAEPGTGSAGRAGVELYVNNLDGGYVSNSNSSVKIGNGPTSAGIAWWDTEGSFFTEGGDMTFNNDDNEKHIVATSSRGPSYPARIQLKGYDPTGGPAVYVAKAAGSTGDVFQVVADGIESGFTIGSGVRVGGYYSLPSCNSYNVRVIMFDYTSGCFKGCNGSSWSACF